MIDMMSYSLCYFLDLILGSVKMGCYFKFTHIQTHNLLFTLLFIIYFLHCLFLFGLSFFASSCSWGGLLRSYYSPSSCWFWIGCVGGPSRIWFLNPCSLVDSISTFTFFLVVFHPMGHLWIGFGWLCYHLHICFWLFFDMLLLHRYHVRMCSNLFLVLLSILGYE